MNLKEILSSKYFKQAIWVVASLMVLFFVFSAGVFVGLEKARFSYGWGENYFNNFAGPRQPTDGFFGGRDPFWDKNYINPRGLFGQIIEVDDGGFVMIGANHAEIPVRAGGQTIIKNRRDNLKLSDLKIGDQAIVIGAPGGRGEINAKFIRIDDNFLHK